MQAVEGLSVAEHIYQATAPLWLFCLVEAWKGNVLWDSERLFVWRFEAKSLSTQRSDTEIMDPFRRAGLTTESTLKHEPTELYLFTGPVQHYCLVPAMVISRS